MLKILVIGATGSTGLYLVDYLNDNSNYHIVATGNKKRNTEIYKTRDIEYISLDVTCRAEFKKLPDNIDIVVLLAGLAPSRVKGYDPYIYFDINTIGTLNTLEYCRINHIKKIIFAQSHSDVAGYWNTGEYIKSDVIQKLNYKGDHAVYVISKTAACQLIEHYHQDYGIQSIIFRMPTIYCYWPDDTYYINGEKTTMAYLGFIKKAIKGEAIEIWGDPTIPKDIIYIKDFIQLVENAIISKTAQGIYNAGTGIPTTLEEQIKGIIEVFSDPNNKSVIIYRPDKPSQISYLYDISKAEKELNYKVKYPYIVSLKDMKREMQNPWFKILM